ncbi:MAG TPA: PIN domain-containing protein [Longimicrobium sp.]
MLADDEPVVVDTNILFSTLLGRAGRILNTFFLSERRFVIGETALVELFEHKEKILKSSKLTPDEVAGMYHRMLRRIEIYKEDLISVEHWERAAELCGGIDADDVPHIALTLALGGRLWTGDGVLRRGLEARGFSRFFSPET